MPSPIVYAQADMPAGYCCRHPCDQSCLRTAADGSIQCASPCPQPVQAASAPASGGCSIGADPPPPWHMKLAGVDAGFWAVLLAALILSLAKHHIARLSNNP